MNYNLLGAAANEKLSSKNGIVCRLRDPKQVYKDAPGYAAQMSGLGANANDPNSKIPYCDTIPDLPPVSNASFIDNAIEWVKANPLLAGAIALGAFFIIKK